MSREMVLKRVLDCGIVAVVRSESGEQLAEVVRALPQKPYHAHLIDTVLARSERDRAFAAAREWPQDRIEVAATTS